MQGGAGECAVIDGDVAERHLIEGLTGEQQRTSVETAFAEGLYLIVIVDGGEAVAAVERVCIDLQTGSENGQGLDGVTVVEHVREKIGSDVGLRVYPSEPAGDGDPGDQIVVGEGAVCLVHPFEDQFVSGRRSKKRVGDDLVIGVDGYGIQRTSPEDVPLCVVLGGELASFSGDYVSGDSGVAERQASYVRGAAEVDGTQRTRVLRITHIECGDAYALNGREVDGRQGAAVCECVTADLRQTFPVDGGQIGTSAECGGAESGDAGHRDRRETGTSLECLIADRRTRLRERDGRETGLAHERGLGGAGDVAPDDDIRHGRRDQTGCREGRHTRIDDQCDASGGESDLAPVILLVIWGSAERLEGHRAHISSVIEGRSTSLQRAGNIEHDAYEVGGATVSKEILRQLCDGAPEGDRYSIGLCSGILERVEAVVEIITCDRHVDQRGQ